MKTADDLWEISTKGRYELVKGEIREMTPAGGKHGLITSFLTMKLHHFAFEHKLGIVLAAETGIKLPGGNVRAADVTFISRSRQPREISEKYEETIPDLVVEVLSPNDSSEYVTEKVLEWLGAGVKEVWVVDSSNKLIFVYTAPQKVSILGEDNKLESSMLPGFSCGIREIFAILQ